jgi:hypothetical protein
MKGIPGNLLANAGKRGGQRPLDDVQPAFNLPSLAGQTAWKLPDGLAAWQAT